MAKPKSYADAAEQAGTLLRQGRLADPGEHFPYKRDDAVDAGLPAKLADATAAYVDAQQAYLEDPSEDNRDAYHAARDELVASRMDYRGNTAPTATTQED